MAVTSVIVTQKLYPISEWGLPAALRVCSRRTAARSTATMGLDAAGAAEAEVVGGVAEAPASGAVEVAQGSAE